MISKKTLKEGGIVLLATIIGGFLNYLFNIVVGRLLGPGEYGAVVSLFSVLVIISVPIATIQTVIAKYTADFNAKNENSKIKHLIVGISKQVFIGNAALFVLIIVFSGLISRFLNLSSSLPVILMAMVLFPAAILPVNRGVLQGLQMFFQLSLSGIAEAFFKLFFAVGLVLLGLSINGAVSALPLAMVTALLLSVIQLKPVLTKHGFDKNILKDINYFNFYKYSWSVILNTLCFIVFTNITILLVKHYFAPNIAGYYASTEIIGKIVLFVTGVIPVLLFPKAASLHAKKMDTKRLLLKGIGITALVGICFTIICFIYNEFIVFAFFGEKYIEGSYLLGYLAVVMTLYSVFNIMSIYQLSINKFSFLISSIIIAVAQVVFLILFHKTLLQMVTILIICSALLVVVNLFHSLKRESL